MNFDEISEKDLRNAYAATRYEDRSTMSEVVSRWDTVSDGRDKKFLWEALNQFYLNGFLEAEDNGSQMIVSTDEIESFDELEYLEPQGRENVKTELRFEHGDRPVLPASIMYDHFDRHDEIDAVPGIPGSDRVAAERNGNVKLRYVIENDYENGEDVVHMRGFFPESLWNERHSQRYFEEVAEPKIMSLVQRSRRVQDSAEKGLEILDGMDKSLEHEVERLAEKAEVNTEDPVEALAEAYYSKGFDGGTDFLKPYSDAMEIDHTGEGDIGVGETFGDTDTAEDRERAGREWLEFYLDIIWEESKR